LISGSTRPQISDLGKNSSDLNPDVEAQNYSDVSVPVDPVS